MSNTHEIDTALGTIITEVNPDPNYPGIYLALKRGQNIYGICLMEVLDNETDNPALNVVVWNPKNVWEDPEFTQKSSKKTVDAMFEEVVDG